MKILSTTVSLAFFQDHSKVEALKSIHKNHHHTSLVDVKEGKTPFFISLQGLTLTLAKSFRLVLKCLVIHHSTYSLDNAEAIVSEKMSLTYTSQK